MSLSDAKEAAKTQGMGVLLDADLDTFPQGVYGYYMGEYHSLSSLNYADVAIEESSEDTDMLIQIWGEFSPQLLTRIEARSSESPHIWISSHHNVWVTDAGMAQIYDLFDDDDKDELGCYIFERNGESTLFSAIDMLIYSPIVSMEHAWGELDPDDYTPNEKDRERIARVEDPLVQQALQVMLGNDAYVFEMFHTPAELSTKTQGVYKVCEFEDEGQQDFTNCVLYLPAERLKG
jgi:hypothetical protein